MTSIFRKLAVVAVACAFLAALAGQAFADDAAAPAAPAAPATPPQLAAMQKEYTGIYDKVRDSVVGLAAGNEIFTGFFISDDGLILTNGDIEAASQQNPVFVIFANGERKNATLVATDKFNYICLLKADLKGVKPLELGDSASVKVGQFVMTLGNVFGSIQNDEEAAFSVGLVSGLYRLTGDSVYSGDVIETDAAINAGGEGGPMINADGKVVGIAAKAYSRSRFLGTAVPIDQVKMVLDDLKAGKPIYSGYFGAQYKSAEITDVDKDSPAEKAGLKKGDKITEIDGVTINTDDDIAVVLGSSPAGCTTNMTVKRGEDETILPVTLGKGEKGKEIAPPEQAAPPANPPQGQPAPGDMPYIGFTLADKEGGVEVVAVEAGSPAAAAIVSVGQMVVSVDGKAISTVADFDAIFATLKPGQEITLSLKNKEGWTKEVKVVVGKRTGRQF
jgi:serine protease Do